MWYIDKIYNQIWLGLKGYIFILYLTLQLIWIYKTWQLPTFKFTEFEIILIADFINVICHFVRLGVYNSEIVLIKVTRLIQTSKECCGYFYWSWTMEYFTSQVDHLLGNSSSTTQTYTSESSQTQHDKHSCSQLDAWIEQLLHCEKLAEEQVRKLCDKVRFSHTLSLS